MTFHVDSEVGRLRQVIVHRPGLELTRLTPDERRRPALRRRDVGPAGPRGARRLRRRQLRDKGVNVHHFAQLLAEALDEPAPGSSSRTELTTRPGSARRWTRRWTSWSSQAPATGSPSCLIGGVLKSDLAAARTRSLLLEYLSRDDFLLAPLPNHLFQRDNSAWVYDGLSHQPDGEAGPQAGDDQLPAGLQLPPDVRAPADFHFYYGNDYARARAGHPRGRRHPRHRQRRRDDRHGRAHHAAGRRVPRPAAVRAAARSTKIIAVELPKTRAFMHLDTAMTMVDRDAFIVYPYLPDDAAVVHAARRSATGRRLPRWPRTTTCCRSVADALGRRQGARAADRRSTCWAPSASSGTTATTSSPSRPGVIVGYERNTTTNTLPAQEGHRGHHDRRLRARPRPRRPAVHDLPDRDATPSPDVRMRHAPMPSTCATAAS